MRRESSESEQLIEHRIEATAAAIMTLCKKIFKEEKLPRSARILLSPPKKNNNSYHQVEPELPNDQPYQPFQLSHVINHPELFETYSQKMLAEEQPQFRAWRITVEDIFKCSHNLKLPFTWT